MTPNDPLENASPVTRERFLNALARRKSREASFQIQVPPSSLPLLETEVQQAQSSRSQGGVHWENTKPGRVRVVWFAFCFLLFFMILGILVPVLANPTGLQALFTGIQTTGLVTGAGASGRCHSFTFTFVDSHHQVQHITDPSLCLNGFVSYGDHVTIWYQQDHPSQMITASELHFDLIFFLGFSSPMLLFLAFRGVSFVRGPMKHLRQVKRGDIEDVYRH